MLSNQSVLTVLIGTNKLSQSHMITWLWLKG